MPKKKQSNKRRGGEDEKPKNLRQDYVNLQFALMNMQVIRLFL
jgi:hypothetical protein